MDLRDAVVALEIGGAKTAAIVAQPDKKGRLEVVSLAYSPTRGLDRGRVVDEDLLIDTINLVLGKVERHLQTSVSRVYLAVGSLNLHSAMGQAMTPIFPEGRAVKRQDVHSLIQLSRRGVTPDGEVQVLVVPRGFSVDGDWHTRAPEGLGASKLEVETHIISGLRSEIDQIERVMSRAGREIAGIYPVSLASGLGTLSSDGLDLGAIVIDIGSETTSVGVFLDGTFAYQAVVPLGSAHVSRDVMQLLSTDWDEAERLKCEHGDCFAARVEENDRVSVVQAGTMGPRPMQRKVLAEIIESRMREIFESAVEALEEFAPLGELPIMAVLTGGGSVLKGSEQLCGEIFNGKVCKVAQPKVAGRFSGQVASPMLSTLVGVARYALESDEDEFAPASGSTGWRDRIRTLISRFEGKK
jgi:cell division protein FtsA